MISVLFKAERKLEQLRLGLKQRKFMRLEDAFDYCARSRRGAILASDLRDVLAE